MRPRLGARKVGVERVRGAVVAPEEREDDPERDVPVDVLRRVTPPDVRGVTVLREPERVEGVRRVAEPRLDGAALRELERPDEVEDPLRVEVRGRDVGASVGERRRAGMRSPLERLLPVLGVRAPCPEPERVEGTRRPVEGVLPRDPPKPEFEPE